MPFAFERHWKRLQRDADRTHIPFPFEAEVVRARLGDVIRANQVREGTARIYVLFNKVGFWRSDESFPEVDLILYTADFPAYRDTARLALREHGRYASSPLVGVKTTAWLNNVWHLYEAQQGGWDEVVLLNERGEVAECTAANVFCVKDGTVWTPPLSSGCLEGITRGVLMEITKDTGVPVKERALMPADLYAADEVFISSTNRSALGVEEIQGHAIAGAPGPITKKLERAVNEYIREYCRLHAAASSGR